MEANSKVAKLLEAEARKDPKIEKLLEGKIVKKVIYVPGKVVNLVTEDVK